MLKVCTSYSKKIPADEQYSSKQFHASVEIELSDALSPEQLQVLAAYVWGKSSGGSAAAAKQ